MFWTLFRQVNTAIEGAMEPDRFRPRRRLKSLRSKSDDSRAMPRLEEIAQALRDHQLIIACGETGSGKSTQLPKICLEMGRGVDGLIGQEGRAYEWADENEFLVVQGLTVESTRKTVISDQRSVSSDQ